ncbi:MAG TPA: autotransporter domain-containing protein, partial [bacterium]|nr:autotransporter domain-containing protein [bacterium]
IFSGVISDSGFAGGAGGSLTKLGTGTLALAGANNYSGGTSIIAGTLAISGNGSLGAGNVWNDSDLVYVNGSTASSPLIVNNSHLDFFDSSSAGDSSITNNSSLTFNDTATAGMAVVTTSGGATVSFAGLSDGGTAQFIVNYGGYFDLSGHSAAPMTVGSIEGDGSFELGANNLTTGSNNLSTTLFGTLSDGGSSGGIGGSLTKIGMGTLTLIGSNFYTGYTSIEAGTLAVGDPHALGAGSVTVNGGTLAITGGPLMLDVGGNYTQTQSGTLQLGVASGLIDSVNVTGAAALGGTLDVSAYLSGVAPVRGQSTTVITAATITGAFQNGGEGAPGIRFLNVYGLTDMALLSIIPSFQELGTTANQKTIGIDLDSIVFNSSMAGLMSQLGVLSDADFRTAENQISPEGLAAIYMAGFEGASSRAGLVGERLSQLMDKVDNSFWMPGFADSGSWYASAPTSAKTDAMASSKTGPWGGFISGNGGFFNVASDSNALGYKASAYGLTGAGADYRLSHEASVGLLVGYGHTDVTLGGGGNLSADGGELGLYGLLYKGGFYGSVLAEGGINSYSSQRFSYNGTASGKTQGTQYDGALEVGYAFKKDKAEIGPFGSLQYAHVGFDGFTEQGSQAALTLPAQGQDSVLGQFGLKSGGYIPMGSQTLHPSVRLAWEHEFNYQGGSIQAGFGQGDSFKVLGSKVGQDGIRVGASVGMELTKEFSVNLNYQGELARANLDSHQFGAGASLGF